MTISVKNTYACTKKTDPYTGDRYACGDDCTGTPPCGGLTCGNVDDMCFCDCRYYPEKCSTTEKGYKWNKGVKLANGSYALNGTKGDGKEYKC